MGLIQEEVDQEKPLQDSSFRQRLVKKNMFYQTQTMKQKLQRKKQQQRGKLEKRSLSPEPEYDLFENISRTSASLHQASDNEDQMPLHPTTTPAAKKAKTSIFISKSKAKPKTPKKSSKSAANNTQKSKNLQEAVLDSVQANNFT